MSKPNGQPQPPQPAAERPADWNNSLALNPVMAMMAAGSLGPAGLVSMLDAYEPIIDAFKETAPAGVRHHLEGLVTEVRKWAAEA